MSFTCSHNQASTTADFLYLLSTDIWCSYNKVCAELTNLHLCFAMSGNNQSAPTQHADWPLQRLIMLSFWCLTAEGPAHCVGEAEESDVLLSHGRAALTRNTSQPLHRAAHWSAADRVWNIRPQLHHPVLQEQRQGAQGEDTHAHKHRLNICRGLQLGLKFTEGYRG